MTKKIFLNTLLALLLIPMSVLYSQNIKLDNWRVHTSMLTSLSAATDSKGRVWVGTQGGIAIYETDNATETSANQPILMNVTNELLSSTINVLKFLPNTKTMIAGCSSGVLEFIDEENLKVKHFTGIRDYNFTDPRINDIRFVPNDENPKYALISGGFGIAEFDLDKEIFTNSVLTIGDFPRNTAVNSIILKGDTIWIATPLGLASIKLEQQINIPTNWETYYYKDSKDNVFTEQAAKIVFLEDKIYVNLAHSIYTFEDGIITRFCNPPSNNSSFTGIDIYNNKLAFSINFQICYLNNIKDTNSVELVHSQWNSSSNGFAVLHNKTEIDIVAFYQSLGCAFIKSDKSFVVHTPNTPMSDAFLGLKLDKNGKLYAVQDNSQDTRLGKAIMSFDGNKWTNYIPTLSDFPNSATYRSINVAPDGNVYGSSWGEGFTIMNPNTTDEDKYKKYDNTNSELFGVNEDGSFVTTGDICFDSKGKAWVANFGSTRPGNMVVTFNADGSSIGYTNPLVGQGGQRQIFNMAIDANDTKWMCAYTMTDYGVYYFNEKNTLEDKNDDIWGNIRTSDYPNLIHNNFFCCRYDKYYNVVWLGTSDGVAVINNPNAVLSKSKFLITKNKLLDGQHINDIFIDVIGNKWFATNTGIWVISPDGSEIVEQFTMTNTPISTNEIQAITLNPDNGNVYIGTKNGLFEAQSTILMPENTYNITTYPQPFNINKDEKLVIDGLTTDSDVRIVMPNGLLVRNIQTSSRRAVWDGKDNNGDKVQPGVYIVISSSTVANTSGSGKIAVIKR